MKQIIKGEISSRFGSRKDPLHPNTWKFHNGIDISAPIETAIHSPVDGTITDTYEHASGGLTLIMSDKELKIRLGFCHLNRTSAKIGQMVKKGDIIAYSGNSGASTGPHLHFSLKTEGYWMRGKYYNGKFTDPLEYLTYE